MNAASRSSDSIGPTQPALAGTVSFNDPTRDQALVVAAKMGDHEAFETLVKRYRARIFALALRYTRVHEDAEDVVQQTFQKMFVYLGNFEGKSSFSTWLTRIAINEALMFLRRARAQREVSLNDLSEVETATRSTQMPDSRPDPEANYLKQERAELLSAAIAKLTLRLRIAIELRELAELSTRETARRMGVSVAAVKTRIFHGRIKLRNTLRCPGITERGAQTLTGARLACADSHGESRADASPVAAKPCRGSAGAVTNREREYAVHRNT